jgi:hypothetical protein
VAVPSVTLTNPTHTLLAEQLGFYREGRNEQGQTMACYVPLPPGFSEAEKGGVSEMLRQEMEGGPSGAVMTIANNDVTNLKERVLTYHWSRSQAQPEGGRRQQA